MEPHVYVVDVAIWMVHLFNTTMTEKPAEDLGTTLVVTWAKGMAGMMVEEATGVYVWLLDVQGFSWTIEIVRVLGCDVPIHSTLPTAKGVADEEGYRCRTVAHPVRCRIVPRLVDTEGSGSGA